MLNNIIIICGEASGDLNAGGLARRLLELSPGLKISGVGGAHLRASGAEVFRDIQGLSVIGLFDALKKLPRFFALKKLILDKITQLKPAAVILVDFSGFNLRLAKAIKKRIPVIYYTSPQVWASRPGRIKTIKKYVHKMLVFFGFEKEFYLRHGVEVDFVGHPLLNIVKSSLGKKEFLAKFNLSETNPTIALLPGSRRGEIKNILPVMLKAAKLISGKIKGAQFIIAKSPNVGWEVYRGIIGSLCAEVEIAEGMSYDCINASDFCLVASGTATLETAIMQKPFSVIYKMSLLNYLLYRPQVRVPFIGMANIVAGRKIVGEFIQFQATPEKISGEVVEILSSPQRMEKMKKELSGVKALLGESGASLRAARIIVDFLNITSTL